MYYTVRQLNTKGDSMAFNDSELLDIKSGGTVRLHSGGQVLINQDNKLNGGEAVILPKNMLIQWLHGRVQFYENLRVRDLFKLLINYPEVIPLFPSFKEAITDFKKLPFIGCCDPKVAYIGIKRDRVINVLADNTDSIMRLCIKLNDEKIDTDDLFLHENPKEWLDMRLAPTKSHIELVDHNGELSLLSVEESYTVFDILSALDYSLENEIILL